MTRRAVFLRFLVALAITWFIVVWLYPEVYRAVATEPTSWAPLPDSVFRPVPAPRPAPQSTAIFRPFDVSRDGDRASAARPTGAPTGRISPHDATQASGAPPSSPEILPTSEAIRGVASWGWFDGHVVTRLPRGTRIEICGVETGRCWSGRSWGYGPDPDIHPGRIADMDVRWWWHVCQRDPSVGLCDVTLEEQP
jgi:hypothetical protein